MTLKERIQLIKEIFGVKLLCAALVMDIIIVAGVIYLIWR